MLAKEAVLDAVGVGAYELHDYVEFSSWFQSTLLPVRRRIVLSSRHCLHHQSTHVRLPVLGTVPIQYRLADSQFAATSRRWRTRRRKRRRCGGVRRWCCPSGCRAPAMPTGSCISMSEVSMDETHVSHEAGCMLLSRMHRVTVHCCRPAAYAALLQLLASDDAAVQLAAINALQVCAGAAPMTCA